MTLTDAQTQALTDARALLAYAGLADYTITPPTTRGRWVRDLDTDRPSIYEEDPARLVEVLPELGYTRESV